MSMGPRVDAHNARCSNWTQRRTADRPPGRPSVVGHARPAALGLAPLPPTPWCLLAGHAASVAAALRAGTGAGVAGVLWGGVGVTLRAGTGAGVPGVPWFGWAGTGAGMRGVLWGGACVTLRAGAGAGMAGVLWGGACVTLRAGTGPGMAGVLWG